MGIAYQKDNSFLRSALVLVSTILIIGGVVITLLMFRQFSRGGVFSGPRLGVSEIITALLAGFYHLLLAVLCYGISEAISTERKDYSAIYTILQSFGWLAIIIGFISCMLILTKTSGLGPISRYGFFGAMAILIYNLALGLPCIGVANSLYADIGTSHNVVSNVNEEKRQYEYCCDNCGKKFVSKEYHQMCECGGKYSRTMVEN